jgi:MATE family multidrug resistance protein
VQPLTRAELLKLALPSMASVILTNAYRSVDQYWIQGVGVEAQAAIGSSVFVLIAVCSAFHLSAIGAAPLLARATGAQDPEQRRRLLGRALTLSGCVGVLVSLLLVAMAEPVSRLIGLEGLTLSESATYLRTLGFTALPLALTPLVDQAFVAMGDTRTPMWLQGLSLLLNAAMTPLFIFDDVGGFGLGLGIAGAALASNASRLVTTGLGLYLLTRRTGLGVGHLGWGPELARILRIGWPAALGITLYACVYWAMLRTSISPLGPHVNAALGIGFSALEGFTWPAFYGISLALSSVVGRALGAGAPEVAWDAVRKAIPLATLAGTVAALLFFFGGPVLTGFFADDVAVHEAATEYAMILAFSQLFVAWEALAEGALTGAGDTRTVFWTSVPLNILRVPLAWAFAFPLGFAAAGIWWAINLTTFAKAGLKIAAVWRGRWAELEI